MAAANPVPPANAVPLNQPNFGPQPNFDRLVQGAQQATDELGRLRNLPAFTQGQAILQAINTQVTQNYTMSLNRSTS